MLSFYRIHVGVKKRFDNYRARFLWKEDQGIKKYHLVQWPMVCCPKDQGGTGGYGLRLHEQSLANEMALEFRK
jgi:hypothetical protein